MRCLFIHVGPCPVLNVSYKPQKISPKSQGTVRQLLHDRIRDAYVHPQFVADVMKPLLIDNIIDQEVITVQPAKSNSDVMFCLQSSQGFIINRSLVY